MAINKGSRKFPLPNHTVFLYDVSCLEKHNIVHFFGMLFFTVLIMCIQTECAGAADQNAVRIAKDNTLSGGIFEEDAAGIRYRKADQTYAERGWARIEGNIYYFDAKGYAKTGAFRWKKNSYRADSDGKLYVRKLYKAGSKTYYYGASGAMVKKAWKTIKGAAYYFKPNGVMARNRWVGKPLGRQLLCRFHRGTQKRLLGWRTLPGSHRTVR